MTACSSLFSYFLSFWRKRSPVSCDFVCFVLSCHQSRLFTCCFQSCNKWKNKNVFSFVQTIILLWISWTPLWKHEVLVLPLNQASSEGKWLIKGIICIMAIDSNLHQISMKLPKFLPFIFGIEGNLIDTSL